MDRFASLAMTKKLLRPAPCRFVVCVLRLDPAPGGSIAEVLALPEWRGRLQEIHQEFRRAKRLAAMESAHRHHHDALARRDLAEAMQQHDALHGPARTRLFGDALQLLLGH